MQGVFNRNGALIEAVSQGYLLGSRTVITATGTSTYTTPASCRHLFVECVGGGGGGSTASNATAAQIVAGSGGNGGGYAAGIVAANNGQTFTAIVNAGGASNGSGGVTSFSSPDPNGVTYVSAQGGTVGGLAIPTGTAEAFTGVAATPVGTGTGSPLAAVSAPLFTHRVSGTVGLACGGGTGPFGGTGVGVIAQGAGAAGLKYGGGGGGGLSVNAAGGASGGVGGQGLIIVWEFY